MEPDSESYVAQLESIELALLSTINKEERISLEALKNDILELIELTKETSSVNNSENDKEFKLKQELELFKSEIGELEKIKTAPEDDFELKLDTFKKKIAEMVGQKCSAPHRHSWGSIAYHNAIICGVEDSIEESNDGELNARLRVLYTNPTHREMLPCSYFLDGNCRFDETRCHFSHGELVAVDDLQPYFEVDFTRLKRHTVVLAKLKDRLWYRGRVLCANFVEKSCRVRLDDKNQKERERDFIFEELLPIFQDDSSCSSNDNTDSEESGESKMSEANNTIDQNLFAMVPAQPLGEWEKHTRGIGSKLMVKMGYVLGTGLGSDGRGIVTPVTAQILPQGCSLDYCMQLREASKGDENFFSVEKKLRAINAKDNAAETQRVDVFSFLNETIFGSAGTSKASTSNRKKDGKSLHQQTTKSLNIASVRIADDIKRKEREVAQMKKSLGRHVRGSDMHTRFEKQLQMKTKELNALQKEEKDLFHEQASRKVKNKLSIF